MRNKQTQPQAQQAPQVTDAVGCPGPEKPCALCLGCALWGAPGRQLEPAVQRRVRFGAWHLWCEQKQPVEPAGVDCSAIALMAA